MKAHVECYAGGSAPEAPRAIVWEGQRYVVKAVLERRREPQGLGFLIHCKPGEHLFDIFYWIERDEWQIQPKGPATSQQKPNDQCM